MSTERQDALREAQSVVEYMRDRITHPNGRRAHFVDSRDEAIGYFDTIPGSLK